MQLIAITNEPGYYSKGDILEYTGSVYPCTNEVITVKTVRGWEKHYSKNFEPFVTDPNDFIVTGKGYIVTLDTKSRVVLFEDTISHHLPDHVREGWKQHWRRKLTEDAL